MTDAPGLRRRPSPNFGARRAAVDMVVLHYTGMESAEAALDRLCDPAAEVSAHYLVDEDGTVWQLVDEAARAWHAGVSSWHGATDVNDRSVGIEIVNPGHEFGYRPFPEAQMRAVETLLAGILARHGIDPARVVGHSDVAPARKQDPGELFDWTRLAAKGLAVWPAADAEAAPAAEEDAAALLAAIGYDPAAPLADALLAFQRRFLPHRLSGAADTPTLVRLAEVARALA
jgi:N-acetylmuramoyl-L-alanine amidase